MGLLSHTDYDSHEWGSSHPTRIPGTVVMLQRLQPGPDVGSNVHEATTIGSEQPFVDAACDDGGRDIDDGERLGSCGLRCIDEQQRAHLTHTHTRI